LFFSPDEYRSPARLSSPRWNLSQFPDSVRSRNRKTEKSENLRRSPYPELHLLLTSRTYPIKIFTSGGVNIEVKPPPSPPVQVEEDEFNPSYRLSGPARAWSISRQWADRCRIASKSNVSRAPSVNTGLVGKQTLKITLKLFTW